MDRQAHVLDDLLVLPDGELAQAAGPESVMRMAKNTRL
jgi:hypothetical protein